MPSIQDLIHKFEEKGGRGMRLVFVVLTVGGLLMLYNWRAYRNFGTQEAMDTAQVARNISQGYGFTTQFVRPFSVHLVKEHNQGRLNSTNAASRPDYAQLKGSHPDLANPPLYPLLLAGAMKVLPFNYEANVTKPFWSVPNPRLRGMTPEQLETAPPRMFARYQPDFLIALLNQALLICVAVLTFFLARRLFDPSVAWMSFVLVIGCEVLWRFSTTGLSTMLLLVIFLALIWCLVWIESEERDPVWSHRAQTWLALAIGLLLGVGTLTRYSFGWLLIPVLIYLGIFCVLRRWKIFTLVLGVFLVVLTPWVGRNIAVSGTPFGTAGYAIVDGTYALAENRLQRSLEPDLRGVSLPALFYKLSGNAREILQDELPKLGGSWVAALFLTGLLLSFRSLALRRLRYFLLGTLGMFILVQALGKTQLSVDSPTFNSENLLVLLVPLVLIYGAGLFFQLLEQMNLKVRELRYLIIGVFSFIACLPMIFLVVTPKASPLNYPPYFPPAIQTVSKYMKPSELIMSDIPWAVAWYGDRQSIWLTANADSQYFAVHDYLKPIRALYLTPQTTDSRFLSQWVRPGERSWPTFVLEFMLRRQAPEKFPLRFAHADFFPEQLFLSDYNRWTAASDGPTAPPKEEDSAARPGKTTSGETKATEEKK
jgi:4-amino-4-deoxy-L-arabinose transferase-like glycosyltransferase